MVLVSRLAALWWLRVRGECRRGPTGYCVVMLISSDWVSPTRPAARARMPRLLGSRFDRTRSTRQRGRVRVPGCLEHGTAKTHTPFPRADPGSTFFSFFFTCPGCERKNAACHGGAGSLTGPVFCAPGSLARRRLVRVIHHHHLMHHHHHRRSPCASTAAPKERFRVGNACVTPAKNDLWAHKQSKKNN